MSNMSELRLAVFETSFSIIPKMTAYFRFRHLLIYTKSSLNRYYLTFRIIMKYAWEYSVQIIFCHCLHQIITKIFKTAVAFYIPAVMDKFGKFYWLRTQINIILFWVMFSEAWQIPKHVKSGNDKWLVSMLHFYMTCGWGENR